MLGFVFVFFNSSVFVSCWFFFFAFERRSKNIHTLIRVLEYCLKVKSLGLIIIRIGRFLLSSSRQRIGFA